MKNRKIQKFGDIVPLANGRLEINDYGHYVISETEENCIKFCGDENNFEKNLTAFWMIEKIRHRDEERGHRFELKVTVMPVKRNRLDNRRESASTLANKSRSFLIKDQDYPKYFQDLQNLDNKKRKRMEKRLFDTRYDNAVIPFHLNYRRPPPAAYYNNLNIGEYMPHGHGPQFPARPFDFQNPFDGPPLPPNQFSGLHPNVVPNYNPLPNLHHHYFLNNQDVPIFKTMVYEKEHIYGGPTTAPGPTSLPNHEQYQTTNQNKDINPTSQTPIHFPDHDNPLFHLTPPQQTHSSYNAYGDNRDSYGQQRFNDPIEYGNSLLSLPPRSNNQAYQSSPPPYQFVSSPSPPPSTTAFYTNQNDAALNQYHQPLFHSQQYQPQLYTAGPFDLRYASTPQNQFEGSYPYQENTFSELDPIYHSTGAPLTATPVNIGYIPTIINGVSDPSYAVSQLPLQNVDVSSSPPSIENQKLQENGDTNYTTPFNLISTSTQKRHQHGKENYPDSINAQLPPPDLGTDLTVPYVDATDTTQKAIVPRRSNGRRPVKPLQHDQNDANSNNDYVTTESQVQQKFETVKTKKVDNLSSKSTRYRTRGQNSETTEKPVLKWVPKGRRRRPTTPKSAGSDPERRRFGPSNTTESGTTTLVDLDSGTESIVTMAPMYLHDEPRTSQSIKKSVSIQVGDKQNVPSGEREPHSIERPFLPTTISHIEKFENPSNTNSNVTRLKWIKTNDTKNGAIVEDLASSIVKRARRV